MSLKLKDFKEKDNAFVEEIADITKRLNDNNLLDLEINLAICKDLLSQMKLYVPSTEQEAAVASAKTGLRQRELDFVMFEYNVR